MISKKLLDEILGDIQDYEINDNIIKYCKLGDYDYWQEINIYEFVHRCKEWAFYRDKWISSQFSDASAAVSWGSPIKHKKFKHCGSEPEAIFKACEWILGEENK